MIAFVLGKVIEIYQPDAEPQEIKKQFAIILTLIIIISIVILVGGYVQYAFMQHMAAKISYDLRSKYLQALLKQEIAFFET